MCIDDTRDRTSDSGVRVYTVDNWTNLGLLHCFACPPHTHKKTGGGGIGMAVKGLQQCCVEVQCLRTRWGCSPPAEIPWEYPFQCIGFHSKQRPMH